MKFILEIDFLMIENECFLCILCVIWIIENEILILEIDFLMIENEC